MRARYVVTGRGLCAVRYLSCLASIETMAFLNFILASKSKDLTSRIFLTGREFNVFKLSKTGTMYFCK